MIMTCAETTVAGEDFLLTRIQEATVTSRRIGETGGGPDGTEPLWYRAIMVQKTYLALLNYIF